MKLLLLCCLVSAAALSSDWQNLFVNSEMKNAIPPWSMPENDLRHLCWNSTCNGQLPSVWHTGPEFPDTWYVLQWGSALGSQVSLEQNVYIPECAEHLYVVLDARAIGHANLIRVYVEWGHVGSVLGSPVNMKQPKSANDYESWKFNLPRIKTNKTYQFRIVAYTPATSDTFFSWANVRLMSYCGKQDKCME